jgi:carbamoyl-phosphate synthase large subunit
VYVLEANPRASRTVPFASKAIGLNLVEAACRLLAGASLSELDLAGVRPRTRPNGSVSVKAAVFPFARFPGADPVLGPEMRSTGEVMASAADFPTAFAKAERAAGRPLPERGTAFLSVRDSDKPAAVELGRQLAALGFELSATSGTAAALRALGHEVRDIARLGDETSPEPAILDVIASGTVSLVVNTPSPRSGVVRDAAAIRLATVAEGILCFTSMETAVAAARSLAPDVQRRVAELRSLQEWISPSALPMPAPVATPVA